MKSIREFFKVKEHKTSVSKEFFAALTTFATMAYILAIQPSAIVGFGASSLTDVNGLVITKEAIMVACALISGITTIAMGFYANLPFALSTGMGNNFLFGAMIQSGAISFSGAMTITLLSGILFVVLTAFGVRDLIVRIIPKNLKIAIGISVGFFLLYLGFSNSGIGSFQNGIGLGDFSKPEVLLALGTIFLIVALETRKVKCGILIGIAVSTIAGIFLNSSHGVPITNILGVTSLPNMNEVFNIAFQFNLAEIISLTSFPLIFVIFCGDFFSTLGTVLGVAKRVDLLDEDGNLPGIEKPFMIDAIGTTLGSCFGCTTVTTFVESATGVEAGARSGLSSVYVGILFLVSIFFAPLFISIPSAATGPALIYIGFLMISALKDLDYNDTTEFFGPFMAIVFCIFAGGISSGICMGVLSHIFIKVVSNKAKEIHVGLYFLAVCLVMYFVSNAIM